MNYAEKLRHPKWQKKRLEVLQRDDFACQCCGDKETTLHVHHIKYTKEPYDAPLKDLKTLCEHCHELEHYLKEESPTSAFKFFSGVDYVTFVYPYLQYTAHITYHKTQKVFDNAILHNLQSPIIKKIYELNSRTVFEVKFLDGFGFDDFGGYEEFVKLFYSEKIIHGTVYMPRIFSDSIEFFEVNKNDTDLVSLIHTGGAS